MAGLTCAQDLSRAGWSVRVVEAGDRPGGRMRTDTRDGFVLDRGFQVFNPGYPQTRRRIRTASLGVRELSPGFALSGGGVRRRFAHPARDRHVWRELSAGGLGRAGDLARFGLYSARVGFGGVRGIKSGLDVPARLALGRGGCSAGFIDEVLRPFFAGVFLEDDLATSSRVLGLVWRSMLRGSAVLPAQGIGAVARQMAEDLPAGTIAYECTVRTLTDDGAVLADGTELGARRVIVATDPSSARALLPSLPEVEVNAVTTYYHVAPRAPIDEPLLVVDADSIVLNSLVVSNVQPNFAPRGYALISTSALGTRPIDESKVRARLAELYDTDTASWELLAAYPVPQALPRMTPPWPLSRGTVVGPRLQLCGDHRATGSVQGAMASGARAAREALADEISH
ncbi:FAD-dependent oxidoreductase [Actinospica sp. MGRD01-02]|uniref:FAD-dependent oxidoreductase n=2 Tax=Actinospica acidithermotolerans TaxID=2828514 RepID=A0A941EAQ9_9ACTN|nr:FAD-dependent oxidoreductase [Actinospica acidithermotolerans]